MTFKKRYIVLTLLIAFAIYLLYPLSEPIPSYSTVLNDKQGNLLGASIASDGQWRFPQPDSVPEKIATCIQYYEDRHFYRHPGVNPLAVGRAFWQNIKAGEIVSGASTLTMQIARMMRGEERTVWQKFIEAGIALKLELKYSKEELMIKYLSMAPFGGNVVGIEAASWRYFNRPPHLLSWGESASLAVLPNNPGAIFPGRSDQQYLEKRNRLLRTLFEVGEIDSLTYELSTLEELPGSPFPIPQKASHLLTTIKSTRDGTITNTTIDPFWQSRSTEILERHHKRQQANGVENAAMLVVDLQSNQVLAYVGNTTDQQAEGYQVDVIQKPRSPGSSLKPLLYARSLAKGTILPQTLLPDIPTFFGGFSPKNFSKGYEGAVPADEALARSLNIPFVYLLKDYTYEQFHQDLGKMGISTLDQPPGHYGLSMILGGAEVTLWELADVYTEMYRQLAGHRALELSYTVDQHSTKKLKTDPSSIWYTFNAMTALSRPLGEQGWQSYSSSQMIAWKTGTSFGFRDAWAIGLNGTVLVAVWVGNADGEGRAGLTGIQAAAPILLETMRLSDHNRNWLGDLQPSMPSKMICEVTGMLAGDNCPSRRIAVPKEAENSGVCPYHLKFQMNTQGTHRVNSSCYSLALAQEQVHFVLPPSIGYYYQKINANYNGIPPLLPACASGSINPIEIVYPTNQSKVFIPIELDGKVGKVILEATHLNANSTLFWNIGDEFYGQTSGTHQLEVVLPKGIHTVKVTDEAGNEKRRTFEVISDPQ